MQVVPATAFHDLRSVLNPRTALQWVSFKLGAPMKLEFVEKSMQRFNAQLLFRTLDNKKQLLFLIKVHDPLVGTEGHEARDPRVLFVVWQPPFCPATEKTQLHGAMHLLRMTFKGTHGELTARMSQDLTPAKLADAVGFNATTEDVAAGKGKEAAATEATGEGEKPQDSPATASASRRSSSSSRGKSKVNS